MNSGCLSQEARMDPKKSKVDPIWNAIVCVDEHIRDLRSKVNKLEQAERMYKEALKKIEELCKGHCSDYPEIQHIIKKTREWEALDHKICLTCIYACGGVCDFAGEVSSDYTCDKWRGKIVIDPGVEDESK